MSKSRVTAVVLAAAVGVFAAGASQAATYTYKVSVKTNFGTRFNDCFTFDKGVLTVAGLGVLDYTAAPTTPVHYYTAVTPIKQSENLGFSVAFAGFKPETRQLASCMLSERTTITIAT